MKALSVLGTIIAGIIAVMFSILATDVLKAWWVRKHPEMAMKIYVVTLDETFDVSDKTN